MKINGVKIVLSRLYARGISDGQDMLMGSRDRFFGDGNARERWEEQILKEAFITIRKLTTPKVEGEGKE